MLQGEMSVMKGQDGTALGAVLVGKLTAPCGCHRCTCPCADLLDEESCPKTRRKLTS